MAGVVLCCVVLKEGERTKQGGVDGARRGCCASGGRSGCVGGLVVCCAFLGLVC